jgi:HD-GYP domain-containing protein (c-di-GMP phosphodiesterase class II)
MSDISVVQRGLQKALGRASLADDRELQGRVREDGRRMAFLLNGLIRSSRMYTSDNAALEGPALELAETLAGLSQLVGAVHLVLVEDQAYVNDVRLRVNPQEQVVVASLISELERHDVGGVSFHGPLTAPALKALARAISDAPEASRRARRALAGRITGVGDVELTGRYRFRLRGEVATRSLRHADVVRGSVGLIREANLSLAAGRQPNPLPVRRAVIELLDSLGDDDGRAGAEPLRRRSGLHPGEQHLLAVCSLALLVGRRLGLSEPARCDLGITALLHDVGYARHAGFAAHAASGARTLLRQRGFHEAKVRRIRAVLDHHLPYASAGSGPPASLSARVLRIADDYDVLTASRAGLNGVPPPTAQGAMWAARGRIYDPDLLALFVQAMGLYPPGSLLELSDRRWVLVVSGGRDAERFSWPRVRVLRGEDGARLETFPELDLYEVRSAIRPRRVLNPATQDIDVATLLDTALDGPTG